MPPSRSRRLGLHKTRVPAMKSQLKTPMSEGQQMALLMQLTANATSDVDTSSTTTICSTPTTTTAKAATSTTNTATTKAGLTESARAYVEEKVEKKIFNESKRIHNGTNKNDLASPTTAKAATSTVNTVTTTVGLTEASRAYNEKSVAKKNCIESKRIINAIASTAPTKTARPETSPLSTDLKRTKFFDKIESNDARLIKALETRTNWFDKELNILLKSIEIDKQNSLQHHQQQQQIEDVYKTNINAANLQNKRHKNNSDKKLLSDDLASAYTTTNSTAATPTINSATAKSLSKTARAATSPLNTETKEKRFTKTDNENTKLLKALTKCKDSLDKESNLTLKCIEIEKQQQQKREELAVVPMFKAPILNRGHNIVLNNLNKNERLINTIRQEQRKTHDLFVNSSKAPNNQLQTVKPTPPQIPTGLPKKGLLKTHDLFCNSSKAPNNQLQTVQPTPPQPFNFNPNDKKLFSENFSDYFFGTDPLKTVPPLKIVLPQANFLENNLPITTKNNTNKASKNNELVPYVVSGPLSSKRQALQPSKQKKKKVLFDYESLLDGTEAKYLSTKRAAAGTNACIATTKGRRKSVHYNEMSNSNNNINTNSSNNNNNNNNSNNTNMALSNKETTAASSNSGNNNTNSNTGNSNTTVAACTDVHPRKRKIRSKANNDTDAHHHHHHGHHHHHHNTKNAVSGNNSGNLNANSNTCASAASAGGTTSSGPISNASKNAQNSTVNILSGGNIANTADGNATTSSGNLSSSAANADGTHLQDYPFTNCFQMSLNIRRQLEKKWRSLYVVKPRPPQGFDDYLLNKRNYLLNKMQHSININEPNIDLPQNVSPKMRDIFTQQECERRQLFHRHIVDREKLCLNVEQEIIRVHSKAARNASCQSLPYSACTLLKDEEVYNLLGPQQTQEDKERGNARHRFNGRQLISWLQDVDDKWEKIKESMVLRHHNEAESLHAVQLMDWEIALKKFELCDFKTPLVVNKEHVPIINVNEDFNLLPV